MRATLTRRSSLDRGRTVRVVPGRVVQVLLAIIVGFAVAGVVGQVVRYRVGCEGSAWTLVKGFDLDREDNFPSWFSTMMLFAAGGLFGVIGASARAERSRWAAHWRWLSGIFVVMSMDELLELHERLIDPIRSLLNLEHSGVFYYAWIVPAFAGLIVGGASYRSFMAALPPPTRRRLELAAAIYLIGAVGFEMLGGAYVARFGQDRLGYAMLAAAEEILEMIGVATLIHGLLDYMGAKQIGLHVAATPTASERDSQR